MQVHPTLYFIDGRIEWKQRASNHPIEPDDELPPYRAFHA